MKYDQKTIDAAIEWVENNVSYTVAEELHDSLMGGEERKKKIMDDHAVADVLRFLKKKSQPQSRYNIIKYVMSQFENVFSQSKYRSYTYEATDNAIARLERSGKIETSYDTDSGEDLWSLAAK